MKSILEPGRRSCRCLQQLGICWGLSTALDHRRCKESESAAHLRKANQSTCVPQQGNATRQLYPEWALVPRTRRSRSQTRTDPGGQRCPGGSQGNFARPWLAHGEAGSARGALVGLRFGVRELISRDLSPSAGLVSSHSWGSSPPLTHFFALCGSCSFLAGSWVRSPSASSTLGVGSRRIGGAMAKNWPPSLFRSSRQPGPGGSKPMSPDSPFGPRVLHRSPA